MYGNVRFDFGSCTITFAALLISVEYFGRMILEVSEIAADAADSILPLLL